MNYEISQIRNFEACNAGITPHIIGQAAASVIADAWASDIALAESITDGSIDYAAETAMVNEALEEAGCKTRADEDDVRAGLARWVEIQTTAGNI